MFMDWKTSTQSNLQSQYNPHPSHNGIFGQMIFNKGAKTIQ